MFANTAYLIRDGQNYVPCQWKVDEARRKTAGLAYLRVPCGVDMA